MRLVLAVDVTVAVLLFGQYIGVMLRGYSWGQRITVVGYFAFTVATLAVQYKARALSIPFDAYSWALLSSVTVTNIGLGWSLWEQRPQKGA